jgi:hypothetical protein
MLITPFVLVGWFILPIIIGFKYFLYRFIHYVVVGVGVGDVVNVGVGVIKFVQRA